MSSGASAARANLALALLLASSAHGQTTVRVPSDYPTIQAGINAAAPGDTVLVAPGTYVENIDFLGKAITVTSEAGAETTLIDGNQADPVVKFVSGEGRASVLAGFTVLNGMSRSGLPTNGHGGGIHILGASPTITGNVIANNRACSGAGISVESAAPLIRGNTIVNNRQAGCGGGTGGGGIIVLFASAAEIIENLIEGNVMEDATAGGGVSLFSAGDVIVRGNVISANRVGCKGGGISIENSSNAFIAENVIAGNRADCGGGGIYWLFFSGGAGPKVLNNTIAYNESSQAESASSQGSGILAGGNDGPIELRNNIVVGRDGRNAVYCGISHKAATAVFAFNNAFSSLSAAYGGTCSDPTGINGNISADSLFIDGPHANYRLQQASPSIDAGDNAAPQLPSRDADGNARIAAGGAAPVVDIGAYERSSWLTPAAHDFGGRVVGSAPLSTIFMLTNTGSTPLSVSSISIGDRVVGAGGPAEFSVQAGGPSPCTVPTVLPTGNSCTVSVTFNAGTGLGRKGATLRVVSDAGSSPFVAALSAQVVVDTSVASSPPQQTISRSATFTFASDTASTTFECRLGNETTFSACSSPKTYQNLAAGLHAFLVRAVSKFGDPDPTPATYFWTVARPVKRDFGGDGKADVLWRNMSTGENYVWPLSGTAILAGEGYLRTVADLDWHVAGIGDFDGDGRADILWRNAATGANYIYLMTGNSVAAEGFIRTVANLNWTVAGIGDLDGDGKDDIVWRNAATGENYLYPMDGLAIKAGEGYLNSVTNPDWRIAGLGDFDGDGKDDILWRHATTGENYLYLMDGRTVKSTEGFVRRVPDLAWQVHGIADFDGDGLADILWRNSATGENYVYPMQGRAIKPTEGYIRTVSELQWQIAALGDHDGDGKTDILWRNASTGENYLYPMDGLSIKPSEGYVRTVPVGNWAVVSK
jgi:hypothetical protein